MIYIIKSLQNYRVLELSILEKIDTLEKKSHVIYDQNRSKVLELSILETAASLEKKSHALHHQNRSKLTLLKLSICKKIRSLEKKTT